MKSTRILAIANQKGGVGKTTTSVNLAAALVEQGNKVLLIDNDPQANLSSYLTDFTDSTISSSVLSTIDELYLSKQVPSYQDVKAEYLRTYCIGMDYISADKNLSGVEFYLYSRSDREEVLRKNLACVNGEYDFVVIDNPPSINLLTLNALAAAHRVLIPVQPEFFSVEGLVKMQETIELVKQRWNPELMTIGILPTMVDHRKRLTSQVLEILEKNFSNSVLSIRIRENAKIAESSGYGKTIFRYAPSSAGAEDYRALAEEVLSRL